MKWFTEWRRKRCEKKYNHQLFKVSQKVYMEEGKKSYSRFERVTEDSLSCKCGLRQSVVEVDREGIDGLTA